MYPQGENDVYRRISLMYIFSYICAKTDSIFLLALCSLFMGFLRMVLMMVNLFTLIKYAGNVEATEKITPGNEPTTGEGWDKLDIERSAAQPAIYLFLWYWDSWAHRLQHGLLTNTSGNMFITS